MSSRRIRIELETPLKGEWFEVEERSLAARRRRGLIAALQKARDANAGDADSGDLLAANDAEDEALVALGEMMVDCSFLEPPYSEGLRDLWGPSVSAVLEGFFESLAEQSRTNGNSAGQSSQVISATATAAPE